MVKRLLYPGSVILACGLGQLVTPAPTPTPTPPPTPTPDAKQLGPQCPAEEDLGIE
jgi:hypothetical protein